MHTGTVFNIQRFSIHDGPGIRTTVFLKGCTLRCFWCHNPEGHRPQQDLQYFAERCIACGECVSVCPNHAHEMMDGRHVYYRDRCQNCGHCVDTCFAGALELTGKTMTVGEVMTDILQDRSFYEESNGGVTLSGGEPALHGDFILEILQRCKVEELHTAIETCGNYQWENIARLLPYIDMVMMDLKHMDPAKHKAACGKSNELILHNARQLAQTGTPLIFRTPVVPTVNDTADEIRAIAMFIRSLMENRLRTTPENECHISLEFLAFHKLAADKYRSLGLDYRARDLNPPSKEKMAQLKGIATACGVKIAN